MQYVMFSKLLQSLSWADTAKVMRQLGFSGCDLTVRPEGHVNPERVELDLPAAIAAFGAEGLAVPMITTAITSASDPTARRVLDAARAQGVEYAKLGYWFYKGFGTMAQAVADVERDLDGLEALALETGMKLGLHIHSGGFITADPMLLWYLLKGRDPRALGAYVDAGHMITEGGYEVWRMGLDLLAPRLFMAAFKDLAWHDKGLPAGAEPGSQWHPEVVPMGTGAVKWLEFLRHLREVGFGGPVSMHSEYEQMTVAQLIDQTRRDMAFIRGLEARQ